MPQNIYTESLLKGRMAESLVEELLKRSGNTVYRFGYESILQNITQVSQSLHLDNAVGERVRAIPDFFVLDNEGRPNLVEVKFRWDPDGPLHEQTIDTLERVEKYWEADMIFVNCVEKPYFRICVPPYFKNVSQQSRGLLLEPLTSVKKWSIDEEAYEECERLVEKYLKQTLKHEE